MPETYNPMKSAEISAEHNYNMIDGILNNQLPAQTPEREKELDKVWKCQEMCSREIPKI